MGFLEIFTAIHKDLRVLCARAEQTELGDRGVALPWAGGHTWGDPIAGYGSWKIPLRWVCFMEIPSINGWFVFHGKYHLEMDDDCGYPYDLGNLEVCFLSIL